MNNWLNRLERKYGRFGIPNLTNILVGGQILVLAIELFVNRTVMAWLALSRFFLLQGWVRSPFNLALRSISSWHGTTSPIPISSTPVKPFESSRSK